jgi:hypothetical protein
MSNEGDVVYVERGFSDAQKQVGDFERIELHKSKDGYSGKEHLVIVGSYLDRLRNRQIANHCFFDFDVVVTTLSASRIESRFLAPPQDSKLDFKKCTPGKALTWQTFVWIPE